MTAQSAGWAVDGNPRTRQAIEMVPTRSRSGQVNLAAPVVAVGDRARGRQTRASIDDRAFRDERSGRFTSVRTRPN